MAHCLQIAWVRQPLLIDLGQATTTQFQDCDLGCQATIVHYSTINNGGNAWLLGNHAPLFTESDEIFLTDTCFTLATKYFLSDSGFSIATVAFSWQAKVSLKQQQWYFLSNQKVSLATTVLNNCGCTKVIKGFPQQFGFTLATKSFPQQPRVFLTTKGFLLLQNLPFITDIDFYLATAPFLSLL